MYPLKFKKVFKEKIWGGRSFSEKLNMELPTEKLYGESWEVSSHKNGMSVVENGRLEGKTLEELFLDYKGNLVGENIYSKYRKKFPLLIKYLDINDKLSVQVHPSDEYALRIEEEFGKSESWYILEASSDAKLIMGLKSGVTLEFFSQKTKNKDFENLFNIISVKKGDFINITPGLIHASLEGSIVICEVQQNSDMTYRIYDFDRLVDGKPRDLHLDKAMDVIDFIGKPEITTNNSRDNIELKGAIKQELIRGEYFQLDKLEIKGSFKDEISSNFKIYSILEGKGILTHLGIEYKMKKGDTYFIPAGIEIKIVGKLEILKSFL